MYVVGEPGTERLQRRFDRDLRRLRENTETLQVATGCNASNVAVVHVTQAVRNNMLMHCRLYVPSFYPFKSATMVIVQPRCAARTEKYYALYQRFQQFYHKRLFNRRPRKECLCCHNLLFRWTPQVTLADIVAEGMHYYETYARLREAYFGLQPLNGFCDDIRALVLQFLLDEE